MQIPWCDSTKNIFAGCTKKSPGCYNCYAIPQAARIERMGSGPHYVGVTMQTPTGPDWTGKIGVSLNALRQLAEEPPGNRCFVNSMSDFWHEHADPELRKEALRQMRSRPDVAYQILTKRPELILGQLEAIGEELPDNIWLGATVESAAYTDRIALLLAVPHRGIRFLSIEPILDDVTQGAGWDLRGIDQVIVGGESGARSRARDCELRWLRRVVASCDEAGVRVFVKQLGAKPTHDRLIPGAALHLKNRKGEDMGEWPNDLRRQEMPPLDAKRWAPLRAARADVKRKLTLAEAQ